MINQLIFLSDLIMYYSIRFFNIWSNLLLNAEYLSKPLGLLKEHVDGETV